MLIPDAALGAGDRLARPRPRPPGPGRALQGDTYQAEGGDIIIHPVQHASFVMTVPGIVLYNDPVGGAAALRRACRRRT